jgi:glycosyltransferase involved in cell wall biosynthesis
VLRSGLSSGIDLPAAAAEDIRWIRARAVRDPGLREAALLQLVRRGGLTAQEWALLRERAAGPSSGIIGWRRGAAGTVVDDTRAALAATPPDRPAVAWLYWPVDNHNPYQPLVYSRFAERGLVPIRLPRLSLLDRLRPELPAGTPVVLHVHWLYWVTAGSTSPEQAAGRVRRFTERIAQLRAGGVRLVWTVHNLLPHETDYPQAELELRRFMVASADVVHLMAADQEPLLRDAYGVATSRTVVVPHPSYVGAYPDWVDRAGARVHLGIPDELRVLATVGQVRPYKGYREFLQALDQVHRQDPRIRWLVAGTVRAEGDWREFISAVASHPAVLCFPSFVPPEELQLFLRGADAAVFPYVRSLNSGALALAASFGLPAYLSRETRIGGLLPEVGYRRFDLADPADLAHTLLTGTGMETPEVRAAVRAHADQLRPGRVSAELADQLLAALGLGLPAARS